MKILITGVAGFIGYHLAKNLINDKLITVVGVDNINSYYDIQLKLSRLKNLGVDIDENIDIPETKSSVFQNFTFVKLDISNYQELNELFVQYQFDCVINLAAQAGVRYSLINPHSYGVSNLIGFINILECCRNNSVNDLIYASSSSVYGLNDKIPFSENDNVESPISLYAATKKSNELMAHSYSNLYQMNTYGLRFFTVYGPYGRPDMAPMLFTEAILNGKEIRIFNNGDLMRDFTFVSDIVDGICLIIKGLGNNKKKYNIYNIGCSNPIKLMDFIMCLENSLGIQAKKNYEPMQPGDVYKTYADTSKLKEDFGYEPRVSLEDGILEFVDWYKNFYK